ncbi:MULTISPECIES: sensor histidine kinase [unclassified Streptomyces]|uniref:sensor histidine kinase n=1 Tax=unclassified Streptomyces TaxID=2593676 RepID=UPI0020333446|nr:MULTISPECIES: histidine kinase [unclassified Streptomyces]MCM2423288.1 histidine kinase [Streptomyces sp. RKAG293]MCM2424501.1 histidine kinase [Streptomyces sp. RKAG337]
MPRLGRVIVALTTFGYLALAISSMLGRHVATRDIALGIPILILLFLLQNLHSLPNRGGARPRYWIWTLSAQGLLTYIPFLIFKESWVGMPGFFSGSLLLWIPGAAGWISAGTVSVTLFLIEKQLGADSFTSFYYGCGAAIIGLSIFGLTRLVDLLVEVQRARAELARLAVAQERDRVARDLHDLLGYSLSAITLKGELVYRLVNSQPERACEEISTMLAISRQALSDVRMVASRYRDMSLAAEIAATRAVLVSADIATVVTVDCGPLEDRVNTVLSTVLREGVSNLLRHSKAQHCVIEVVLDKGVVRLRLENDGLNSSPPVATRRDGRGLDNLCTRLGELGGTLNAAAAEDGWFRLVALVPLAGAAA